MEASKKDFVKPDVSSPLKKRDSYLRVSEDEPLLVTVDHVEKVNISTDGGIKEGVRVTAREVIVKKERNDNMENVDGSEFTYTPDQEPKIKESYSTSTFYLLKDFQSASHWPKEGIFYWVWKASDGLRWEEA
tara:strand:- start:391 stop:786 length:396 start_codon:yes stop_codon:yes gene_type:complete